MKKQLLITCLFALCVICIQGRENLLNNPGLEEWENSLPAQWAAYIWDQSQGVTAIYAGTENPHSGNKYAIIENKKPNDARLVYELLAEKNQLYEFSCWLKIENAGLDVTGANISILNEYGSSGDIRGTINDWQKAVLYLVIGPKDVTVKLTLGLGGYSNNNTGKAMFDSVIFRKIDYIPEQRAIVIKPGTGVLNQQEYRQYVNSTEIKNSGFEDWQNYNPEEWYPDIWDRNAGVTEIGYDEAAPHTGGKALVIRNLQPNDARVVQDIAVTGDKTYEISCWIKTENIGHDHTGAYISVQGMNDVSWDLRGTHAEWEKMTIYLRLGMNIRTVSVAVGLGGFASINTGTALFDSVTVNLVSSIPAGNAAVINIGDGVMFLSNADIAPDSSLEETLLLVFFTINTGLAVLYSISRNRKKPVPAGVRK